MVLHENNVSRSYKDEDQVSDIISTLSFGGGYSNKIGAKSQLVLSGYITYNDHADFSALDHTAVSLGFSLTHQPGTGYGAIWIGLSTNVTQFKYDNSDAREGVFYDLDLNFNRRLSTKTVDRIGYRYLDMVHDKKSDTDRISHAAFDTRTQEAYLGIDREISPFVFVYAEYGYREGGLTSTVSGLVDLDVNYAAETQDPVYDECELIEPGCTHRYAYRVVGKVHKADLGIAFPMGSLNMDLSASYFDAKAEQGGRRYKDWTVRLGTVWNF